MIAVMQAAVDGKEIEYKVYSGWVSAPHPAWNWALFEYRVKPTKPTPATVIKLSKLATLYLSREGCAAIVVMDERVHLDRNETRSLREALNAGPDPLPEST